MAEQMIPAWVGETLKPVEKLAVHQAGLKHPAISVFLRRGSEILLQQRALHKYHTPGLWANTCCTHPHWGEDMLVCAQRRLHEELGITGVTLHEAGQIEYRADVGQGLIEHEVVSIYTAEARADLQVTPNPEEVAAVRWLSLEALEAEIAAAPETFTPWLRIYLAEHAAQIFG